MNIYTLKIIILETKAAFNLDKSKFWSSKLSSGPSYPSSAALAVTCALFRTTTMQKKWACLAPVPKFFPEKQPTTVVQLSPQSWKSGISWWTDVAWFQKNLPVVLPYGCVDSDQRACVSGKASNVFSLVKSWSLALLWHPRLIFDYGSI